MCDLNIDIKKDRVKSILALYSVFLAFATPIKFYFDAFLKLLPYVALAFGCLAFFLPKTVLPASHFYQFSAKHPPLFLLLTGFSFLLTGFLISADRLPLAAVRLFISADRLPLLARCYLLYRFKCLADLRFTRIKSRAHPNASYILCPHSFMCHTAAVKPCTHCDPISIV